MYRLWKCTGGDSTLDNLGIASIGREYNGGRDFWFKRIHLTSHMCTFMAAGDDNSQGLTLMVGAIPYDPSVSIQQPCCGRQGPMRVGLFRIAGTLTPYMMEIIFCADGGVVHAVLPVAFQRTTLYIPFRNNLDGGVYTVLLDRGTFSWSARAQHVYRPWGPIYLDRDP